MQKNKTKKLKGLFVLFDVAVLASCVLYFKINKKCTVKADNRKVDAENED